MKKTISTIVWVLLLGAIVLGQEESPALEPDAYRIVFLDSRSNPIATASIVTKEFTKQDRKAKKEKCRIQLAENTNTGKEVTWFKRIIPDGGEREVEIVSRKNPDFGGGPAGAGGHVMIEFNPGAYDSNVHVTLNLDKKPAEGTWSYAIMAGGFDGGKIQVTRIRTEKDADATGDKPSK